MAIVTDDPFILTPIDNILPRYQVSKLLFFPSLNSVTTTETIDTLRNGLEKTVKAFPLLAGTVQEIQADSDYEQNGRLCVSAPWHTMSDIFSVQDLTNFKALDYKSLQAERFPGHKLDAATFQPQDKESLPNVKSVMLAKVNKIRGGLIVVHTLSHAFMDGGGMAVIAKVWAAFCRGEDGAKYLTPDVLDRSRLMWGTGESQVADFPELTYRSPFHVAMPAAVVQPQGYEANATDWISTSDALCALLSHSIKNTRDERIPLTLGLTMDFRACLDPPLPPDYIGNAVHMLNISVPQTIREDGPNAIATTAHRIRRSIQAINESYIHLMIGALNSENVPNVRNIFHTRACPSGGQFLTITSWTKQALYELDWGEKVGTRIERVRTLRFQYPNLVLIAPMLRGPGFTEKEKGGVEVIFGLEAGEMGRLKSDNLFGRFASW